MYMRQEKKVLDRIPTCFFISAFRKKQSYTILLILSEGA